MEEEKLSVISVKVMVQGERKEISLLRGVVQGEAK